MKALRNLAIIIIFFLQIIFLAPTLPFILLELLKRKISVDKCTVVGCLKDWFVF